ncbi:MAG TPA: hypothetical protein DIU45_09055 [Clostridium sp.]|nr:hypothetical protein [Clostridium sp.]
MHKKEPILTINLFLISYDIVYKEKEDIFMKNFLKRLSISLLTLTLFFTIGLTIIANAKPTCDCFNPRIHTVKTGNCTLYHIVAIVVDGMAR